MKTNKLQFWLVMVFCLIISTETLIAQNSKPFSENTTEGWTHPWSDLVGSSYYPFGSSVQTEGIAIDWQTNLASFTTLTSYQPFTGDVTGDSNLEIVFTMNDSLYIYSCEGDLLLQQDISKIGQNSNLVNMLEDINEDGKLDVGIAYSRGLSNYGEGIIRFYDGQGVLLKELVKNVSSDIAMYPVTTINNELIVAYNSGYGKDPRGFSRWDMQAEIELWNFDVGPAYTSGVSIADIDNDGLNELSFPNWTPHNGASGHGTTDGDTYTVIINENADSISIEKNNYGSSNGHQRNMFVDLENDDNYKLLTIKTYNSSYPGTSRIHLSTLGDTIEYTYEGLNNAYFDFGWGDLDSDGTDEIVALNWISNDTATLVVVDSQLNLVSSMGLNTTDFDFKTIADFDGDGTNEIIIYDKNQGQVSGLNISLEAVWEYSLESKGNIAGCAVSDNNLDGKLDVVIISGNELISISGIVSPVECDELKITYGTYTETDDLVAAIQNEFGMNYSIADWNDLQGITEIEGWIACMELPEDQTFMLTRDGEYYYGGIRQYLVHYSSDGIPYPNYLVHDQIGPLYLGSWYGLNQQILAKNYGGFIADFNAEPTQGVAPLDVQFEDQSMGTPTSWQWDFDNDGLIDSDLQNPEWTYNDPGQYTVCLTVSDSANTSSECKIDYINVTPPYTPVEC